MATFASPDTDDSSPAPQVSVSALIRATVFVKNLEATRHFYRELGFSETYFSGILESPAASSLLGLAIHRPYPVHILKQAGPNFGMLGFFELHPDQQAEVMPVHTGPARIGEVALVFYVPDLDKTLPKLKAAGAVQMNEPELFELQHISQREVSIRDCNGILVNLIERDPSMQNKEGL